MDGRAYELVSPPLKNGGDVVPLTARTRAAADGSAASFMSLRGFGDVVGAAVSTEYESVRATDPNPGTNGWATHAITPPQATLGFPAVGAGLDPLYEGDFSADLSTGAFRSWSPLTDAPNVANVPDLYVRRNLRSAGAGAYELVSDCPGCSSPLPPLSFSPFNLTVDWIPSFAGASDDFHHVLFESPQNLTADASGTAPKLYESDHGAVRLAGVLPDGTAATSSVAGLGAADHFYTTHTISRDGSRVFFTADPSPCSAGPACGALYMRVDHATTIQLNGSERTDCADHDPCSGTPEPDPDGTQPAAFGDASRDGSRIYFVSQEALTDDAQGGSSAPKLYMYDASKPDSDPHNLTFLSADHELADGPNTVVGVIGASDDGRYVYYVATGQLVAGAPIPTGFGIFVWHDGTTRYVGEIRDPADVQFQALNGRWGSDPKKSARVTPDGLHLLFSSVASVGPTGLDQGSCGVSSNGTGPGCREFYRYDAGTGQLTCVSCSPDGKVPTTNATDTTTVNAGASSGTWHVAHAIADDGSRVFFNTAEALVPEDTNGRVDAYEWEADGVGTCQQANGCIGLISSGKGANDSYFLDASTSGDDVFFATRDRLVGWDRDDNFDLYDARVHGGFPEPPAPATCSGDACQGSQGTNPAAPVAGTVGFSGHGNVRHRAARRKVVRCRRGQVRKRVHGKVRCVKKRRPRHRAAHRAAARHASNGGDR